MEIPGVFRKWAAQLRPFVQAAPGLGTIIDSIEKYADRVESQPARTVEPLPPPAPVAPSDEPPSLVVRVSEDEGFVGVEAADFFRDQITGAVVEGKKAPYTITVNVIVTPVETAE